MFYRQLLLCRVALGKSFFQFSAMKMAHAPPGHHSVVGRPSVGGLSFPEYVIYRGEQVTNTSIMPLLTLGENISILGLSWVSGQLFNCQTRTKSRWWSFHKYTLNCLLFVCDKIDWRQSVKQESWVKIQKKLDLGCTCSSLFTLGGGFWTRVVNTASLTSNHIVSH